MGIWTKYGAVISPIAGDLGHDGLNGVSNGSFFYESSPVLISANADGKVFKAVFTGATDLYYAESNDAITWTRQGTKVLSGVTVSVVFKNSTTFYLYGGATPWTSITCYTSTDLINWSSQGTAMSVGTAGNWDDATIYYLSPIANISGTWYALYAGIHGSTTGSGIATSADLITWTNAANATSFGLIATFANIQTRLVGSRYYAWGSLVNASGGAQTPSNIGRSSTPDITNWAYPLFTLLKSLAGEGTDATHGNLGPGWMVEVSGKTYQFMSSTADETNTAANPYSLEMALAPYTLAQIVATPEQRSTASGGLGGIQLASDDFIRGSYPENPLSNGAVWTTQGSACKVVSAGLAESTVLNTAASASYTGIAWPNDQYSEFCIGVNTGGTTDIALLYVRGGASFSANSYQLNLQNGAFGALNKHVASVTTNNIIVCSAQNGQTGKAAAYDIWRLSVVGTSLTVYQNGAIVGGPTTDVSLASGNAGFGLYAATSSLAFCSTTFWAGGSMLVNTPTFSPVAGSYTGTQTVTVSNIDSTLTGFAMYYTTDGTTPTTGSTAYTVPVAIAATATMKVLAVATGYANSAVGSAAYTITAAATASKTGFVSLRRRHRNAI